MPTLQTEVDQLLCGDHPWAPMGPGWVIVGFEVQCKHWEGKPTLDGWDNVASVEVVGRFARMRDAETLEKRLREQRVPNRSYEIWPIQLQAADAVGGDDEQR